MIEYTGLGKSKQPAALGFSADVDAGVWLGESGCFHYQETLNDATDWSHMARAYRADTLLSWLLERGYFEYIMANAADEIVVAFSDSTFPIGTVETRAKTLTDALADVVFTVLASRPKRK